MTRNEIIRMAREVGMQGMLTDVVTTLNELERFAALVAAKEREECAKVCDAEQKKNEDDGAWLWEAKRCAAAIRARRQS